AMAERRPRPDPRSGPSLSSSPSHLHCPWRPTSPTDREHDQTAPAAVRDGGSRTHRDGTVKNRSSLRPLVQATLPDMAVRGWGAAAGAASGVAAGVAAAQAGLGYGL